MFGLNKMQSCLDASDKLKSIQNVTSLQEALQFFPSGQQIVQEKLKYFYHTPETLSLEDVFVIVTISYSSHFLLVHWKVGFL